MFPLSNLKARRDRRTWSSIADQPNEREDWTGSGGLISLFFERLRDLELISVRFPDHVLPHTPGPLRELFGDFGMLRPVLFVNAPDVAHPKKNVGRQPALPNRRRHLGVVRDIQHRATSLDAGVNGRFTPNPLLLEPERLLKVTDSSGHIRRPDHGYC